MGTHPEFFSGRRRMLREKGTRSHLDALAGLAGGNGKSKGKTISSRLHWWGGMLVKRWKVVLCFLLSLYPLFLGGQHALNAGYLDQSVEGKVMVVYARCGLFSTNDCAGMMSEFHAMIGALHYAETHNALGVRPFLDTPMYVDDSHGPSWWSYFFTPDTMYFSPPPANPPEVHLNSYFRRYGRLGGFGHLVYGPKGYLYPMTHALDRHQIARLINDHFQLQPSLQDQVDGFVDSSFDSRWVLGVHYRGLDTVQHYPYYKIEYDHFWDEMAFVLMEENKVLPAPLGDGPKDDPSAYDYAIFVATDELEFLQQTKEYFAPIPVLSWDSPRKSASSTVPLHKADSIPNFEKGESVLIDALLMSRTDYLIKGRSGVSEASLAFNPDLPYSFFISRDEIYRDSLPSTGDPERLEFLPKP